jgi:hypothetical protein
LAITGYERCSIILGGKYQFVIERPGRHLGGGVPAFDQALCGCVERLSLSDAYQAGSRCNQQASQ